MNTRRLHLVRNCTGLGPASQIREAQGVAVWHMMADLWPLQHSACWISKRRTPSCLITQNKMGHSQEKSSLVCPGLLWYLHTSSLHSYRGQVPRSRWKTALERIPSQVETTQDGDWLCHVCRSLKTGLSSLIIIEHLKHACLRHASTHSMCWITHFFTYGFSPVLLCIMHVSWLSTETCRDVLQVLGRSEMCMHFT